MSTGSSSSSPFPAGRLRAAELRAAEDLLRAMLECEHRRTEAGDAHLSALGGLGREETLRILAVAREAGWVKPDERAWRLTEAGRAVAVRVMRAHRLTETDLARNSSVRAEDWHDIAHQAEHRLSDEEVERLSEVLGHPRFDPHGDPIPTREGAFPEPEGRPLLGWPAGRPGVVSHIEDEPPSLFACLAGQGIFAGMRFVRRDDDGETCVLDLEGEQVRLPAELAGLIRVRMPLVDEGLVPEGARRLVKLRHGGAAEVLALLPGCIGSERSRLLDLGFVPGSRVEHELDSPFRGPVAYRVRGTLVALRPEQARQVLVRPLS